MFIPFHDDNPTERTPWATFALIGVNVLALIWLTARPPLEREELVYRRGFIPARVAQLTGQNPQPIRVAVGRVGQGRFARPAKVLQLPADRLQILLSLVTCMFLHGGWLHLIGNMWFLWLFGNNVEDHLGPLPFLGLYLVGGLIASGVHWLSDPSSTVPVIGASGAVAAVLGAYAIAWPWARVHTLVFLIVFFTIIDLPALLVLGVWFLGQLISGQASLREGAGGGVAWWAHVGGFIAGLILMPLMSNLLGAGEPILRRRRKTADDEEDEEPDWAEGW
jgi:membrane associated rhomboid family serine protease